MHRVLVVAWVVAVSIGCDPASHTPPPPPPSPLHRPAFCEPTPAPLVREAPATLTLGDPREVAFPKRPRHLGLTPLTFDRVRERALLIASATTTESVAYVFDANGDALAAAPTTLPGTVSEVIAAPWGGWVVRGYFGVLAISRDGIATPIAPADAISDSVSGTSGVVGDHVVWVGASRCPAGVSCADVQRVAMTSDGTLEVADVFDAGPSGLGFRFSFGAFRESVGGFLGGEDAFGRPAILLLGPDGFLDPRIARPLVIDPPWSSTIVSPVVRGNGDGAFLANITAAADRWLPTVVVFANAPSLLSRLSVRYGWVAPPDEGGLSASATLVATSEGFLAGYLDGWRGLIQPLDADGLAVGEPIVVDEEVTRAPIVAAGASGPYLVAWTVVGVNGSDELRVASLDAGLTLGPIHAYPTEPGLGYDDLDTVELFATSRSGGARAVVAWSTDTATEIFSLGADGAAISTSQPLPRLGGPTFPRDELGHRIVALETLGRHSIAFGSDYLAVVDSSGMLVDRLARLSATDSLTRHSRAVPCWSDSLLVDTGSGLVRVFEDGMQEEVSTRAGKPTVASDGVVLMVQGLDALSVLDGDRVSFEAVTTTTSAPLPIYPDLFAAGFACGASCWVVPAYNGLYRVEAPAEGLEASLPLSLATTYVSDLAFDGEIEIALFDASAIVLDARGEHLSLPTVVLEDPLAASSGARVVAVGPGRFLLTYLGRGEDGFVRVFSRTLTVE